MDLSRQQLTRGRWHSATTVVEPAEEFFWRVPKMRDGADLIERLVPPYGITMLHEQPRDMKSLITLELLIAMATGTPAFGLERLQPPGRVPV